MKVQVFKDGGRWRMHFPEPDRSELDPTGELKAMDPDGEGFATSGDARRAAKKAIAALHRWTSSFSAEVLDHDPTKIEVEFSDELDSSGDPWEVED